MSLKFYKVNNQIIFSKQDLGLEQIVPNTVDAAKEKHVPHVEVNGNKVFVQVGEVIHPMLDNHYIGFILIETNKALHQFLLAPGKEPKAELELAADEECLNVYEHCNLHGLWAIK